MLEGNFMHNFKYFYKMRKLAKQNFEENFFGNYGNKNKNLASMPIKTFKIFKLTKGIPIICIVGGSESFGSGYRGGSEFRFPISGVFSFRFRKKI